MSVYDALKQAALRVLPDGLLQPLKKRHYAKVLDEGGTDEPEFKVLERLVQPGDTVMDLGANIGAYTKLLGTLVGAEGRVYSVEPIPSTFELLGCNIERYKLRNVKPINAAVSDEIRTVEMEVPEYEHGGENFYQATIVSGRTSGRRRFMVRTTTVDTICSERVHFIKCDVEGHESAVIRGASQTIQRHRPAWMVEVSKPEVLMAMRSMGYQAFLYDGTALRSQTDQDHPVNSFFLTDAHLELLRKRGMSL